MRVVFARDVTRKDSLKKEYEKGKWLIECIASQETEDEVGIRPEWLKRFTPGDVVLPASYHLQFLVNKHLSGRVSPELMREVNKNDPDVLGLLAMPHDLIGALWLLFALRIDRDKEYVQCTHCGRPFTPSRTNQIYCYPSSCKVLACVARKKTGRKKVSVAA